MSARLLDPVSETRVGAAELLARLLDALPPHAQELGAKAAIEAISEMAHATGAQHQRQMASTASLTGMLQMLAANFIPT
jgi:gamma-glutamyl:cysteine ligase YbdK (ATP-grasp superfamily)